MYQQSKQSPLESDGQQFTPISTKQTITSRQWWSTLYTNINKIVYFDDIGVNCWPSLCRGDCLHCWYWCELLVNTLHQYQQSKQSPLESDGQQFTPISTKRPITSREWWSTLYTNINKAKNHLLALLILVWIVDHLCLEVIVYFDDIGVNCWPSLCRGDCLHCWYWCELLTITLYSDGQQFTPISTKRPITSREWWSTLYTNINKAKNHL
jgi:hypothetical protein